MYLFAVFKPFFLFFFLSEGKWLSKCSLSTQDRCCFCVYDQKCWEFLLSNSFTGDLGVQARVASFDISSRFTLNSNPMFCRPPTMRRISVFKESASAWSKNTKQAVLGRCYIIRAERKLCLHGISSWNTSCLSFRFKWTTSLNTVGIKVKKVVRPLARLNTVSSILSIIHIERKLYLYGIPSWNSSSQVSRFKWNVGVLAKQGMNNAPKEMLTGSRGQAAYTMGKLWRYVLTRIKSKETFHLIINLHHIKHQWHTCNIPHRQSMRC